MYEPPPGFQTVFQSRDRAECMQSRLVLEAVGIASQSAHQDGVWFLNVRRDQADSAAAELEDYRQENAASATTEESKLPIYGGAGIGVWIYAGIILLIACLDAEWALDLQLVNAGRMQAGAVTQGAWWRSITALTLHVDAAHVVANLAFGAVFGLLAGRVLGGGVAWLAIVVAGGLGNLINAFVQAPTHSSIGASTAVFAALGLVVSHALRDLSFSRKQASGRWRPLIGGVLLLAYTGTGGERTDVAAHVTGFLAGMLIGWIGARLPGPWLSSSRLQKSAGLAAVAIVVSAWMIALSHSR